MKELAETIQLDPEFALAHYGLGKALAQIDKPDWAAWEFREALRTDPELGIACFDLGLSLEEAGRPDEAVEAYERFVRVSRKEYGALCEMADRRLSELKKLLIEL